MIYVTHDRTEAMTMGDRIILLNEGVIRQIDTSINIYNDPNNKISPVVLETIEGDLLI